MNQLHEATENLPFELSFDGWEIKQTQDEKWVCTHQHTDLETTPLNTHKKAIEQALWLATFYDLILKGSVYPKKHWKRELPTKHHREQYEKLGSDKRSKWQIEYGKRIMDYCDW